eukprot:TRINITY_DN876_c0_g1_i1.p1 TRINITY_DN876_c0_g1~~TRINITY_DN876_c0_g1_i1.p1  ORF type:complete len:286 (-),score=86.65 TRINITY_DN876_c0_g1_i1:257-1114(-)
MSNVETVELSMTANCLALELEDNYSMKFQNFFTKDQFQTVVETVNEIHAKYSSTQAFGVFGVVGFVLLLSCSGFFMMIATPDPTVFMMMMVLSFVVMFGFIAFLVATGIKVNNYRKTEMAKCCNKFGEQFPGTNWMYKQETHSYRSHGERKTRVTYKLRIELQQSPACGMQQMPPMQVPMQQTYMQQMPMNMTNNNQPVPVQPMFMPSQQQQQQGMIPMQQMNMTNNDQPVPVQPMFMPSQQQQQQQGMAPMQQMPMNMTNNAQQQQQQMMPMEMPQQNQQEMYK